MPQPQRHTELSILQSYLLPPSPLPTILPYSVFLNLVPSQHRSHPHLKRLYRDLQFQRTIDVDTVRQNITREVARGVALKSQLARRVAKEQGRVETANDDDDNNKSSSKKRKRVSRGGKEKMQEKNGGQQGSDDDDSDDDDNEANNDTNIEENSKEFTSPNDLAIDTTYFTSSMHPAHTDTTLPTTTTSSLNHPLTSATRKHHTVETLLTALDSARSALETEISDIEAETERILADMNEIVGSFSDLRYGWFARPVSGGDIHGGGGGGGGEERTVEDEILNALEGLERRLEQVTTVSMGN